MDGDIHITSILAPTDKIPQCKPDMCTKDDNQYKLECATCLRLVHYKCTQLPLYQIQQFLTKNYRRFICVNCVEVPDYLMEIVPDNEEISQLKTEITRYENTMKAYEDNELKLRDVIIKQQDELQDELQKQQDKFDQAGNPDYDAITNLEDLIKRKLEDVGNTLKKSFLKELHANNKQIEKKLEEVISDNKTYADSVNNKQHSKNTPHKLNQNLDFRAIMKETKNEELAEESDKQFRKCNIILHGVMEADIVENTDKTYLKRPTKFM